MSISINALGQQMAMDGHIKIVRKEEKISLPTAQITMNEPDLSVLKAQLERFQTEFSNRLGRKVQFNVNQELGKVIVKVVDPSTDKVIKEIPSEDIQNLQIKLKHAYALLVDEQI